MTGQPPDDAPRPEDEGLDYRDVRLAELEGELAASLAKIDQLTRRIGQLNAMVNNMGRAAQAVRVTRLGIRRPNTLVRLPVDLFRAVAHPVPQPEPPQPGPSPEEAERRRSEGRQLAAAVRTVERRLEVSGPRDVSSLRVAFVGDEPLRLGLDPECDLVPLPAVGWREAVEDQPPDLLLVQSAWRGMGGSWAHRIAWYPYPDSYRLGHLRALVAWCRERSVPTVFWSTEDPLQVERFAAASALFDHVMTVDPGSVDRLSAEPGRSAVRVAHLAHAVQPRLYHPAPLPASGVPAVFVGAAYRGAPYLQRQALDRLLDAGARAGLEIRDRKLGADPRLFGFAERHRPLVGAWLPTAAVPDAIRAHRVLVGNPDAAVVPVRVLEAIASGRPVVTTPEAAAASAWPGAVLVGDTDAELDGAFAAAIDSDGERQARVERSAVAILETATFRHRLAAIARAAGIDVADPSARCGVVALADDAATVDRLMRAAATWQGRVSEIVVGTRDAAVVEQRERLGAAAAGTPVRVVLQADEADALRRARLAAVADAAWVHVASPERPAEGSVLAAQLASVPFADAAVVGSPVVGAPSWAASAAVDPARSIVRRSVLLAHGWPSADAGDDAMARLAGAGLAVYSTTAIDEARP